MALACSIRDFSENLLELNTEEISDDPIIFNLKYIGNTTMNSTAEANNNKKLKLTTTAINKVISDSKAQKKLPEVTLAISPKGAETFDSVTDEPLLKIPIYKISFCSIDAAHETIFCFVTQSDGFESFQTKSSLHFGSSKSPAENLNPSGSNGEDGLVLHAFQCQKKKVAQNVTMTVAR